MMDTTTRNNECKNLDIFSKFISVEPKKKILIASSECSPFATAGALGETVGSLARALSCETDLDIRVIMPLYSSISDGLRAQFKFLKQVPIRLSWRNEVCSIYRFDKDNLIYYFIECPKYFYREKLYGFEDDLERIAFFNKCVLEFMPAIGFIPNVLHCNDYQTAACILFYDAVYKKLPQYSKIKTLFTIHNISKQGKYPHEKLFDIFALENEYKNVVDFDNEINLVKAGIELADMFTTVSPHHAEELTREEDSFRLNRIIGKNSFKFLGILNGIDTDKYNSEKDESLFAKYSVADLSGKRVCKSKLQTMLNLPIKQETPMIAIISKLQHLKGIDLVRDVMGEILKEDIQLVVLGQGDSEYEDYFAELGQKYVGKVATLLVYNRDLASKVYSGADMLLMPSKYEACGISQMIASRYGTIPIVREAGGLFDTVKPVALGGNGFSFAEYNPYDMLYVLRQAISYYRNKENWEELMKKAMSIDFSWHNGLKLYEKTYFDLLK